MTIKVIFEHFWESLENLIQNEIVVLILTWNEHYKLHFFMGSTKNANWFPFYNSKIQILKIVYKNLEFVRSKLPALELLESLWKNKIFTNVIWSIRYLFGIHKHEHFQFKLNALKFLEQFPFFKHFFNYMHLENIRVGSRIKQLPLILLYIYYVLICLVCRLKI